MKQGAPRDVIYCADVSLLWRGPQGEQNAPASYYHPVNSLDSPVPLRIAGSLSNTSRKRTHECPSCVQNPPSRYIVGFVLGGKSLYVPWINGSTHVLKSYNNQGLLTSMMAAKNSVVGLTYHLPRSPLAVRSNHPICPPYSVVARTTQGVRDTYLQGSHQIFTGLKVTYLCKREIAYTNNRVIQAVDA